MSPEAGIKLVHTVEAWDLSPMSSHQHLDFLEVFAGDQAITKALRMCQLVGESLDQRQDITEDVLSPEGLVRLIHAALRIRHGGLLWAAVPCRSWCWVGRASTGRHRQVQGDWRKHPKVLAQNALLERVSLVLRLLQAKHLLYGEHFQVHWVVENPQNSLLWDYPAFKAITTAEAHHVVRTELGAYGADSQKPVYLKGTPWWLPALSRTCPKLRKKDLRASGVKTTEVYVDKSGRKRCTGSPQLKATQVYPPAFGCHVASLQFRSQLGLQQPDPVEMATLGPEDLPNMWGQGQVAELFACLPRDYQEELRDAWWLADFNGAKWDNSYAEELKVEHVQGRKRRKQGGPDLDDSDPEGHAPRRSAVPDSEGHAPRRSEGPHAPAASSAGDGPPPGEKPPKPKRKSKAKQTAASALAKKR